MNLNAKMGFVGEGERTDAVGNPRAKNLHQESNDPRYKNIMEIGKGMGFQDILTKWVPTRYKWSCHPCTEGYKL